MKRMGVFALVLVYILCLMLTGCREAGTGQSSGTEGNTVTAGSEIEETTGAQKTDETLDFTPITDPEITVPKHPLDDSQTGTPLQFGDTGRLRIAYTVNLSSVRYITSAADLPGYEEFAQYDDAWFQNHALVLVTETVGSGSVELGINAIHVEGGMATVTLSHEMKGQAGTADMATWLLWTEVETGLDYQWTVANPAIPSQGVDY